MALQPDSLLFGGTRRNITWLDHVQYVHVQFLRAPKTVTPYLQERSHYSVHPLSQLPDYGVVHIDIDQHDGNLSCLRKADGPRFPGQVLGRPV